MTHFQLHFEPETIVLYEEHNGQYHRAKWQEIYPCKGIKRIHYNTKKWKNYLIIDIDNSDIYKYREQNLPEPNFILHNKAKPGGHLFYVLSKGIYHQNEFYLKQWQQVFKSFTAIAGGDPLNKGYVGKFINSIHFNYEQIEPLSYDISYLHSFINHTALNNQAYKPSKTLEAYKDTNPQNKKPVKSFKTLDLITIGERNNTLFDKIRKHAYIEVLKLSKEDFENHIFSYATKLNESLLTPLNQSEINATAKSIIKYCLSHISQLKAYCQDDKNRGIMNLEKEMHIKEKQKLGAEYTAEQKRNKTLLKLQKAILDMKQDNIKINISSLSKYSEISRPTVMKYREILEI